jgi:uncharacterized integral membrane protein
VKYVLFALVIVLVLAGSTFGVQNPTPINVRFLQFESGFVPLSVLLLAFTLIGMLLVALMGLPGNVERRRDIRRLRHRLAAAETQIATLKDRLPPPVMQPLPEDRVAQAI